MTEENNAVWLYTETSADCLVDMIYEYEQRHGKAPARICMSQIAHDRLCDELKFRRLVPPKLKKAKDIDKESEPIEKFFGIPVEVVECGDVSLIRRVVTKVADFVKRRLK